MLELWWNLTALQSPCIDEALAGELASLLLTRESDDSLAFLNSASPALAWRWMRAFDYCLLYRLRVRDVEG